MILSKRFRKDPHFDGSSAIMCPEFVEYKLRQGYSYNGKIHKKPPVVRMNRRRSIFMP